MLKSESGASGRQTSAEDCPCSVSAGSDIELLEEVGISGPLWEPEAGFSHSGL